MGRAGIAIFVIFGILYCFGAMFVWVGALFAMIASVGPEHGAVTGARAWLVYGVSGAAFALAWLPYALWVRRSVRRHVAAALSLFEKGTFHDGRVVSIEHQHIGKSRTTWLHVTFVHEGKELTLTTIYEPWFSDDRLQIGAPSPVLYLPGHPTAATFAVDGAMRIANAPHA